MQPLLFARARSFKNIFLGGHSLGSPIVEYYQGDNPSPLVKAVGLYGPHIDIPSKRHKGVPTRCRSVREVCCGVPLLGCERQGRRD